MPTLTFTFNGTDQQVINSLRARSDKLIEVLTNKMTIVMLRLQQKIQRKLSGEVLQNRDGVLFNSIQVQPTTFDGHEIIGTVVGAGGPATHGIVHEEGGTRTYKIEPVNKKALALMEAPGVLEVLRGELSGKGVVVNHVWHPPAIRRPFMSSSLTESIDDIRNGLQETITAVLGES